MNRTEEVIRFCESLNNQIEPPNELIIIDSNEAVITSNEKFTNFLRQIEKKMDICYIHIKASLTKARNIGVKKSKGDILYFFDDDVILEPDFLQIVNKTFENNLYYMGGMGTIIGVPKLTTTRYIRNLFRRFFLLQHDYGNGKFQKSGFPRHPYGTKGFREVEVLGGCFMSYRKEIFKEFNFDENLTGNITMEDVDFSRRVSYKYKLFYNPDAKLDHRHAVSGRGNIRENSKRYLVCHHYLFYKNFYLQNKLFIIPHWWSILGLIIFSIVFELTEVTKGYIDGLMILKRKRNEPLCNWVVWSKS